MSMTGPWYVWVLPTYYQDTFLTTQNTPKSPTPTSTPPKPTPPTPTTPTPTSADITHVHSVWCFYYIRNVQSLLFQQHQEIDTLIFVPLQALGGGWWAVE